MLDEDAEKIWADPELVVQRIPENVIANSLNAMPMGGTLTVHTTQQNGMVRVEISDSGSGQDAEPTGGHAIRYAAKLEGAGLGLATIQTVVSDHRRPHGLVEAIPGAGTAFRAWSSRLPQPRLRCRRWQPPGESVETAERCHHEEITRCRAGKIAGNREEP